MLRLRDSERGDTIIEVLIAVSIISLVLVSGYATTNRSTQAMQNNQERIQAQHLAETQLEMLHANGGVTVGWCFSSTGAETSTCNAFTQAGSGAIYTVKITEVSSIYTVKVTWAGLGVDQGDDSIDMVYRIRA